MTNEELSQKLRTHARELANKGENLYRVRAFRQAAMVVMGLGEDVSTLLNRNGRKALEQVPGIGQSLAETIEQYVVAG